MAKTTSTTKAKTKTTKKPATKAPSKAAASTTKKPVAAKKTAKPAVKAAVKTPVKATKSVIKAAEAPKVTKIRENTVTPLLNRVHVQVGILFAVLAGFAAYFMSTTSVQVLLGHLAKDDLESTRSTVLAPAAHVLYEVEFRWLIVGFLAAMAVLAVLRGTRYLAAEAAAREAKSNKFRWIDYAVTGSLIFSIAALLNGVQDLIALKMSAIAIIVSAYLAWVFEREQAATGKPTRSLMVVSAGLAAAPVAFILITMLGTYIYGVDGASNLVRSPWYAYAAAAIASVLLLLTVATQWRAFKKVEQFAFVNRRLNRVAFAAKLLIAVIVIVGLQK